MHTAQAHQPGEYADQQAVSSLNLTNYLSIFTTQPAKIPRRSGTPTYWTGNGRQPYSVQDRNVSLQIYLPPLKPGFMEPMVVAETTHAFFPVELFDEVDESHLGQGYIFGRAQDAFVMINARHALQFVPFSVSSAEANKDDMLVRGGAKNILSERYDLVQTGAGYHYFVIEASNADAETFAEFILRTLANEISFDAETGALEYHTLLDQGSAISMLAATYASGFTIDGVAQDLDYHRYDNPYVTGGFTTRKPGVITFAFAGKTLTLDYQNNLREIGD